MQKKKNNKKNKKKNFQHQDGPEKEQREDRLEFECEVMEALPGTLFKLRVLQATTAGDVFINATLAGKLRQHRIRILPGDTVKCEVSPYDLSRGRITWRKR